MSKLAEKIEIREVKNGFMILPVRAPNQYVTDEECRVFETWPSLVKWLEEYFGIKE